MSTREQEIFEIIKKDPMISQNDLANALGITRSSVSVYVTSMLKKGLIKGRGYVVAEQCYPIVIGAVNVDFLGIMHDQNYDDDPRSIMQDENALSFRYGGIAKNIAECLVGYGYKPQIITALANDIFGTDILRECREHGIATDASLFLDNAKSSMHFEIRSASRGQITGLANIDIEKQISPRYLETKYQIINNATAIVVEDGLNKDTIEYLVRRHQDRPVYILASGHTHRIKKYIELIDQFAFVLIPSRLAVFVSEVGNIDPLAGDDIIHEIMMRIKRKGVKRMLVPFSNNKLSYLYEGKHYLLTMPHTDFWDDVYSHYRDVLMASALYCISNAFDPLQTLKFAAASCVLHYQKSDVSFSNPCVPTIEKLAESYGDELIVQM